MKIQPKINGSYLNTRIQIKETPFGDIVDAKNGLYRDGGVVKLGGKIIEKTTITTDGNNLNFDGGFSFGLKAINAKTLTDSEGFIRINPTVMSGSCIYVIGDGKTRKDISLPTLSIADGSEVKDGQIFRFMLINSPCRIFSIAPNFVANIVDIHATSSTNKSLYLDAAVPVASVELLYLAETKTFYVINSIGNWRISTTP